MTKNKFPDEHIETLAIDFVRVWRERSMWQVPMSWDAGVELFSRTVQISIPQAHNYLEKINQEL
jgi:hypothetical protein